MCIYVQMLKEARRWQCMHQLELELQVVTNHLWSLRMELGSLNNVLLAAELSLQTLKYIENEPGLFMQA